MRRQSLVDLNPDLLRGEDRRRSWLRRLLATITAWLKGTPS